MRILLLILVICAGGFFYKNPETLNLKSWGLQQITGAPPGKQTVMVEMYSLTTCGYCIRMARNMQAAGIRFVRYDMDTNLQYMQQLNQRLINAGQRPGGGVPILFVGNQIFRGEVPISTLEAYIRS